MTWVASSALNKNTSAACRRDSAFSCSEHYWLSMGESTFWPAEQKPQNPWRPSDAIFALLYHQGNVTSLISSRSQKPRFLLFFVCSFSGITAHIAWSVGLPPTWVTALFEADYDISVIRKENKLCKFIICFSQNNVQELAEFFVKALIKLQM